MKVIVKYQIIDHSNLTYGMFKENGEMIQNRRITDRKIPLGGTASNIGWLKQDVHRITDEILEMHPEHNSVEYELFECNHDNW